MNRRPPVAGTAALKDEAPFTYADYRTWPDDERWELIRGVAYNMSPAPRRRHQRVLGQLYSMLEAAFRGRPCKPHIAPVDVFWTRDPDADLASLDTITQPDLLVACDPRSLRDEGIVGAPDLVLEILSPSTAWRDQTDKRQLHEEYGVRGYWIVNPDTLEVLVYTLCDGAYGLPRAGSLEAGVESTIFPGLKLAIDPKEL